MLFKFHNIYEGYQFVTRELNKSFAKREEIKV